MDGVRAHAELAGDHAERSTASDGSDHGPTAGGLTVSLVMVHLSRGRRFPSSLPAERSGCSVTQVFGMLCHLPPKSVVSGVIRRSEQTRNARPSSATDHVRDPVELFLRVEINDDLPFLAASDSDQDGGAETGMEVLLQLDEMGRLASRGGRAGLGRVLADASARRGRLAGRDEGLGLAN